MLRAEEPSVKVAKLTRTVSREAASKPVRTLSIPADEPVDVGRRSSSRPARRPPSNVVHVTGLVRPFTLGQLKELLGRTGTLVEDGFWIDSIKSHCYVVVRSVHVFTLSKCQTKIATITIMGTWMSRSRPQIGEWTSVWLPLCSGTVFQPTLDIHTFKKKLKT